MIRSHLRDAAAAENTEAEKMTPPAEPLAALRVPEADYLYGVGQITIRVETIDRTNPVRYDGDIFFHIVGTQLSSSGTVLGHRKLLVRGSRLPTPPT